MYKRTAAGWIKHIDFLIIDIICLQICLQLAYFMRIGISNPYMNDSYRSIAIIMVMFNVIVVLCFESLKNVLKRGYYREFVALFKQVCFVFLLTIFYTFVVKNTAVYSRKVIMVTAGLFFVLNYGLRIGWKKILLKRVKSKKKSRSVLIVTSKDAAEEVLHTINEYKFEKFRIAGIILVDEEKEGTMNGIATMPVEEGIEFACREWVDEVFLSIPKDVKFDMGIVNDFMEMGITIHLNLGNSIRLEGDSSYIEKMSEYTVLTSSIKIVRPLDMFLKRVIDILGGLAGCLITVILIICIGPIIYIKSPGPIFFAQTRIGRNGKKFKIYKFRSMYMDAEERKKELMEQNRVQDGMMFKMDNDPRIIGSEKGPGKGIGNFIRKFSLDEFPQFFNVLKGEMSIVGTRPPTVDEWEKYELHHRSRLAAKPGITGMWQVSGRSDITDFEEVVELDRKYITNWNIGLDIKILFKTILVVFKREGSM